MLYTKLSLGGRQEYFGNELNDLCPFIFVAPRCRKQAKGVCVILHKSTLNVKLVWEFPIKKLGQYLLE